MRYLTVSIDDNLCRTDEREQWRAEGILADALLLVGDTCRPSGVGIEDRVNERLYAAGSVEDVLVALAPLLGLQKEVGIVEYACIAQQHIDRRLELLHNRGDKGTADGLAGLSAAAGFLQL